VAAAPVRQAVQVPKADRVATVELVCRILYQEVRPGMPAAVPGSATNKEVRSVGWAAAEIKARRPCLTPAAVVVVAMPVPVAPVSLL
jgi:hypothetical protein